MPVHTVDEVLHALDTIIERALRESDRRGYFAVLYRKVTAKVKEGLETGFFDDADRTARLDVLFADRYLEAEHAYSRRAPLARSWQKAFDAGTRWRPILLQHLLVGVNAHINLDLGIAAARCVPRDQLPALHDDYLRVNQILASLIAEIGHNIGTISPWIGLLDRIGGRGDDEIIRFSIERARACAWEFANRLATLSEDDRTRPIAEQDRRVAHLADVVLLPGPLSAGLLLIRARESNDVRRNIEALAAVPAPSLAAVEQAVQDTAD